MIATPQLSSLVKLSRKMRRAQVLRSCERTTARKCRRGCMRAALNPCIDACIRIVADPAIDVIGLPHIVDHIFEHREKLLMANQHRPPAERKLLDLLSDTCLDTCVPHWMNEWSQFCDVVFKRICIRICTCVCERSGLRSCRLPCKRTPVQQLYKRGNTQIRAGASLVYCISACVSACMRTCEILAPKWFDRKGKHVCRAVLTETANKLAAKCQAANIIKERKSMTDKCNVLNGCKF